MGVTTPPRKQASREHSEPRPLGDLALQLWVLAVLIAQLVLTCWWFGRMYAG